MKNGLEVLKERGFIEQMTHEDEITKLFEEGKPISFYIGFDATADSLTAGHFLAIMGMAHLQRAGHRPIALVGGGTTKVGDPSGRTDMRKMLTDEQIAHNANVFKEQLSKFLDFSEGKAMMVNNDDWLSKLGYVDLLREVGSCFSVNRMLSADCYKSRMEVGLTFLEFNYMIMQSYDFLELNRKYGCSMQMGGNDQWSNILGGVELIRRLENKPAFGVTFKLLTTSEGIKMGKTAKGALWLDPNKTSPYEFFQYWRNIEDVKVEECLALLTFLPMDEVRRLGALEGAEINKAKEVLAFEVTKIVHGEEEANKAMEAARSLFGGAANSANIPTLEVKKADFESGVELLQLLVDTGLAPTKSEARRNVEQGGVKLGEEKVEDVKRLVTLSDFADGKLLIQKGKKKFHQIVLVD
ncbi:MAG: tyrosine--tRNA ligase [Eubacteriales bacterium]|nr:tyrosine--tRNA ligase [Eubacteriales bacterium]